MTVRLTVPELPPAADQGGESKPGSVEGKAKEMLKFLEDRHRTLSPRT